MNPRLPTSKKWTSVPPEFLQQIRDTLQKLWAEKSPGSKFFAEGRIFPQEIVARIGILEKGRLAQNNFEISRDLNPKEPLIEQITSTFDASMALAEEFLNAGEEANTGLYPRTWKEFKFSGKAFFFQFTTENTELEAEANRWLGEGDEGLFNESDDDEIDFEALEKAADDDGDSRENGLH